MTYPSGKVVDYAYDIMNRLKTVTLEGATPKATTYTWNALSQREQLELPNGSKAVYTYDALNRLESLTNSTSNDTAIAAFTYTHDKVGNRKTMTDNDGLHQYNYDDTYQLTSADYPAKPNQGYAYDPAGNRETVTEDTTETAYTVNGLNQYTNVGAATYTYNDNGCLTSKTVGGDAITYEYDYENRLTTIKSTVHSPQSTVSYKYDYLGRRIKKSTSMDHGLSTVDYIYDGNRVIAEYDGSNNLRREYVYGVGIDEVLMMVTPQSTCCYYHYDGLGSVRTITNNTGATIETYTYDVYGKPTIYNAAGQEVAESQLGNRFYFTGREFDNETGLYYYRARYYNPELGRFMSPDPMGLIDGPNLYTYCGNDSVNWVDPLGRMSQKHKMGPQMMEPEPVAPPIPKDPTPKDPTKPKEKDHRDLNGDGVVDKWDGWVWFWGRRLWDFMNFPDFPGGPYPPGFGNEGPGSSDSFGPDVDNTT